MVELDDLPVDCIARILSQVLTTPLDAGRCATFSRTFRSAADSDEVWRNFPPPDLDSIVSNFLPAPFGPSRTRKKLFLRLCKDPLLIDSGLKSFALEKWSGKKCYIINARDLTIELGDTPTCWRWNSLPDLSFLEVAELVGVCWLEVHAKMEMRRLSAATYYAAYFIFKFVHKNSGFKNEAVEVSISCRSKVKQRSIHLDPDGRLRWQFLTWRERRPDKSSEAVQSRKKKIPQNRGDGWKEIYLGQFFVKGHPTGVVQISLINVKSAEWKSGLVIRGIELRPTQMTSQESSRQRIGQRR